MFKKAIKKAINFSKCANFVIKNYKQDGLLRNNLMLVLLNEENYFLTTKSNLNILLKAKEVNANYKAFKQELSENPRNTIGLENKYKLNQNTPCMIKFNFNSFMQNFEGFDYIEHPSLDLAVIHFTGNALVTSTEYARFSNHKGPFDAGEDVCIYGCPFAEFGNFAFNKETDEFKWLEEIPAVCSYYPVKGMITRNVASKESGLFGFEIDQPSYIGMFGGPALDENGNVLGIYFANAIIQNAIQPVPFNVVVNGKPIVTTSSPIVQKSHIISAETIIKFLEENNIKYYEQDLYDMEVN